LSIIFNRLAAAVFFKTSITVNFIVNYRQFFLRQLSWIFIVNYFS